MNPKASRLGAISRGQWNFLAFTPSPRRVHLSPDSPVGLDLKLLIQALEEPPKILLKWSPSVLALGSLRGVVLPVLGPALQGCPVDGCVRLIGELFYAHAARGSFVATYAI